MENYSSQTLASLPSPETTQRLGKIIAALDCVMQPSDRQPYHKYHPAWSEGLQVAQIDNGAGDHLFCLFSPLGTVLKGFDHESPLSPHAQEEYGVWPGIYDGLPAALSALLDDPAFEREDVTFCVWQSAESARWETGPVEMPTDGDDGSSFLLGTLFPTAEEYVDWARYYYGTEIAIAPVQQVYAHLTLDEETAREINPSVDYAIIRREIQLLFG